MKSTNNYLNPQDFAKVIDEIPRLMIRKWYDDDVRMLFRMLYWCALRPIEGIRLSKEDFDLESRKIYLGKTKTHTNDVAPIPMVFIPELEAYLNEKEPGRLFDGLTYNSFYPWLKKLGKLCDIPAWITPQAETGEKTVGHIFRKSIGKDMLTGVHRTKDGKKFDIPIISKQLRHSKPSITVDSYLKSTIEAVLDQW
jgi:integrase